MFNGKISLLHKNFDFSKNAVRNFNFILGYTIFTLISIIHKSFKKKSRLNFSFYSIIFLTLIILKPALESTNSNLQSQLSLNISLNPGPTPNNVSQSFWKSFENKSLHFLHLNISSILPKVDELIKITGNTNAAILV